MQFNSPILAVGRLELADSSSMPGEIINLWLIGRQPTPAGDCVTGAPRRWFFESFDIIEENHWRMESGHVLSWIQPNYERIDQLIMEKWLMKNLKLDNLDVSFLNLINFQRDKENREQRKMKNGEFPLSPRRKLLSFCNFFESWLITKIRLWLSLKIERNSKSRAHFLLLFFEEKKSHDR